MDYTYKCGLKPGTKVRLRRHLDIVLMTKKTPKKPVMTHLAGQVWVVLQPRPQDPVVFFLRPDGEMHTWDDSIESINEYFDILEN